MEYAGSLGQKLSAGTTTLLSPGNTPTASLRGDAQNINARLHQLLDKIVDRGDTLFGGTPRDATTAPAPTRSGLAGDLDGIGQTLDRIESEFARL